MNRTDTSSALPDSTYQWRVGGIDNLSKHLNDIISGQLSALRATSQGVIENGKVSGVVKKGSQWRQYLSRACEQETPGQNVEAESHLMAVGGFGSLSRDTFSGSET